MRIWPVWSNVAIVGHHSGMMVKQSRRWLKYAVEEIGVNE
jgi:hypothetical protein